MITFEEFPKEGAVEAALEMNSSWTLGCPGKPGKSYMECLADWKVLKIIVTRKIKKDLAKLNEEKGNTFAMYVWHIVEREIAVKNWQFVSGPFPIWSGIFSRAQGIVRKTLTGKSDLDNFAEGLLKNGKAKPRTVGSFKR